MKIRIKITVVGGRVSRDFYVHDDKRPGGLHRMEAEAFRQAQECGDFPPGCTLSIKSNWVKP